MRKQQDVQRPAARFAVGRQGEWRPAPVPSPVLAPPPLTAPAQTASAALAETPAGHSFGVLALYPAAPPAARPVAGRVALQRVFLRDGVKVTTGDPFEHSLPGVEPAVKVVCYRTRHTIRGLVKEGTMKETNTVLLKPVEMTVVAAAAYATAWNAEEGRLNVPDGTTFESEGITWGLNARRLDNSIHIWPMAGEDTANVTRGEYAPLAAYLKQRTLGKGHDEAKDFARAIVDRIGGDRPRFTKCADALEAMGETEG